MKTSNPVYQVLIPSGGQALLGKGQRVSALNHGQLGLFNYHTGLSVDSTSTAGDEYQEYFLALGINRAAGTGLMDDFMKSAGQFIQRSGTRAITAKGANDEKPKVVDITGITVMCSMEYGIKVEFRNQDVYYTQGYNPFTKYFSCVTGCCPSTACDDCDKVGDATAWANCIIAQINADPDKLITASAVTSKMTGTVTGTGTAANATVTVGTTTYTVPLLAGDSPTVAAGKMATQINTQAGSPYTASSSGATLNVYPKPGYGSATDTLSATGAGVTVASVPATKTVVADTSTLPAGSAVGIRITGVPQKRPSFNGSIPIKYSKTGTDFIVSLGQTLGICNGTVTTVTPLTYNEGSGYDIQYLEYEAGGWNGKTGPYRTNAVTGLQKDTFEYFATPGGKYHQLVLLGEQTSVSGARNYDSDMFTLVAVLCTEQATLTSLVTTLNVIYGNRFESLIDDVATFTCDSPTATSLNDITKDGIVILS